MKLNFRSRTWHTWTGLILALPILLVAITAVLIAHKKTLGSDDIPVAAGWLPGYRASAGRTERNEVRASLTTRQGATYLATLDGLYRRDGERLEPVAELAGTQVRGLAEAPWGRVAAARNGIWLETAGHWRRVRPGEAWSASSQPDGRIVVSLRGQGLLVSDDGVRWQADGSTTAALATLPAGQSEATTLTRLLVDMHTGRAFFGRDGAWLWIDLIGLSLMLLGLTGVTMWWRVNRYKRARQRERNSTLAGPLCGAQPTSSL